MDKQEKKMVAPIVITVIMCFYLLAYVAGIMALAIFTPFSVPIMVVIAIIPLALAGVCIFVLVERIKEIRSGEEDDLSKY